MGKRNSSESIATERTVVKACLLSHVTDPRLVPEIKSLALYISKLKDRAMLFLNLYVMHCLERDHPLPDFNKDSLIYRCARLVTGRGSPEISSVMAEAFQRFKVEFNALPPLE